MSYKDVPSANSASFLQYKRLADHRYILETIIVPVETPADCLLLFAPGMKFSVPGKNCEQFAN